MSEVIASCSDILINSSSIITFRSQAPITPGNINLFDSLIESKSWLRL